MPKVIIVPALSEKGESNWPERWPTEALLAKRQEIGSIAFSSQYMLSPIDLASAPLKKEWLRCVLTETLPPLTFFFGVDPSPGESSTSDYFALAVIGVPQDRAFAVLMACYEERISPLTQANRIIEEAARWHPQRIVIEAVSAQKLFTRYFFRNVSLPIVEARQTNIPKAIRIVNLARRFERGEVFLRGVQRDGEIAPVDSVKDFYEEFIHWSESAPHDDALDAVDKALEAAGLITDDLISVAVSAHTNGPAPVTGSFVFYNPVPIPFVRGRRLGLRIRPRI